MLSMHMLTLSLYFQAEKMHLNPLYLIIPATMGTSFAFMLPVATPPNAIVYATGKLKVREMVGIMVLGTRWMTF
jgi:di/tricarboxylate transporter